jgi:hypothetical protein
MTTCICKSCNCSEDEIAAYHAATAPIRHVPYWEEDVPCTSIPLDESKGDYDLNNLVGHVFYHEKNNVVDLLDRATCWVEEQDGLTVLDIRYTNSHEGEKYSESITVIGEKS